ncbi:hypothetical protein [Sphingomonas montanisoli]|uniref:Uncharacterized protein n=1 Tax=Sphingomonas montanisoli TaxID=2606412 RepID=A0A5D9BZQ6_9SPHN|nr:hypothetical protein [Sphingomonas montanisoli]TZG25088.1 hypothetical protein FYJ91_17660 [Sphingomonas montanisoli]
MDAGTPTQGFDEALKALEALEEDVLREKTIMPAPQAEPVLGITLGDPCDSDAEIEAEAPAKGEPAEAPAVEDALEAATAQSLAQVSPVAEVPAEPKAQPTSRPNPPATASKLGLLPVAAAGMGVFASLLSVVGLIVASRTVADASLVVADARERQAQMVQVGKLVSDLEKVRAKQIELLKLQKAAAEAAPLSKGELNASMDALRLDLADKREDDPLLRQIRDGQNELANMIGTVATKVSRIEGGAGGVSEGH